MWKNLAPHLVRGKKGEKIAASYLSAQGIRILAKNVHYRCGEIDIVGLDDTTLVFIEVRLRQHNALVSAAESITYTKRKRWKAAAQNYLLVHYPDTPPDCRFDAVLITENTAGTHEIEWIRDIQF